MSQAPYDPMRAIQHQQNKKKRKQEGQQRQQTAQQAGQAAMAPHRSDNRAEQAKAVARQRLTPQLPPSLMRPPQAPAPDPGDRVPHPVLGPGGRNPNESMNQFDARQQAITARNMQRGDAERNALAAAKLGRVVGAPASAIFGQMQANPAPLPLALQRQQIDNRNAQQQGAATAQATREQGRGQLLQGVGEAQMPGALVQQARHRARGDVQTAEARARGDIGVSANELAGTREIAGAQRFTAEQANVIPNRALDAFQQHLNSGGTPRFLPAALRPMPQAAPPQPIVLDQGQASFDPVTGRQIASNATQQQVDPRAVEPMLAYLQSQRQDATGKIWNDNDTIAAADQRANQIINSQMGGGVPQPQGNVGGATQAQPMPANATPQSLQNGVIYQTRLGPARWDALAGRFVSLED